MGIQGMNFLRKYICYINSNIGAEKDWGAENHPGNIKIPGSFLRQAFQEQYQELQPYKPHPAPARLYNDDQDDNHLAGVQLLYPHSIRGFF